MCVLVVQFNGVEQKEVGDGQAPITTKLVLEQDEEKDEPLIQVNPRLICKLKPHQVEGMSVKIPFRQKSFR
jgi:transcriptional regulator ATRX